MSELPKGWRNPKIKELCSLYNGRAFKQTEWSTSGLPIIRIQNLNKKDAPFNYFNGDFDKRHFIQKGDLLFAWSGTPGTSFGTHEWKGENAVLNQHIFKIEFSNEFISKGFFRHAINHKLEELIGNANGGVGLRHVTKGVFENTKVAFPPLAEQKRIIEKLDQVLAQVDTIKARLDGIPAILKRFRQSVLAAAVSGKLTEGWRGMSKYLVTESEIGKISRFIDYRGKTPTKTNSGIPLITAKNIKFGFISREPREYIAESDYESWMTRGIPKFGDVLITTEAPMGNIALIDIEEKFALAQRAICLQFCDSVNSYFASIYMRSSKFQKKLDENATGSTVKGIKASLLKKVLFEYPDLSEQTEIVRLVDQYFAFADTIEKQVQKAQQRVDKLTQSILAKAFRGELVPQDPNDEPAEELLKRIAAARAESEALAKAAKKINKKNQ